MHGRWRFGIFLGIVLLNALTPSIVKSVVVSTTLENTTVPPDDPGWGNIAVVRGSTAIYLGNRWMLTARHIGAGDAFFPDLGSFSADLDSQISIRNDQVGLSEFTDLLMFQLHEDPGLPALQLAKKTPTPATPITLIGNGRDRQADLSYWNVTGFGNSAVWHSAEDDGEHSGFGTLNSNTVRWGTNLIERDTLVEPGSDRGNTVNLNLGGLDVVTVLSEFDLNGSQSDNFIRTSDRETATAFESQAVLNDSGGGMFFKEDDEWVLGGVILAVSGFPNQPTAATTAIYGNATFYADVATYRDQILGELSIPGDFDLDGRLTSTDINLLADHINSVESLEFDLNGDLVVDLADHRIWVEELKRTYFGDANLDGEFSTADMVQVFTSARYDSGFPADWTSGDWNADGIFDSQDFIVAWQSNSFEKGPRPEESAVKAVTIPEPSFGFLTVVLLCSLMFTWWRLGPLAACRGKIKF